MAKKKGRRNNKLKKAASIAAKASDTVTSATNPIEECWFPILNSSEHPRLLRVFHLEHRERDLAGCIPMLFDHGSNNETPSTTNAIPTWVALNYDYDEDEFFAKVLDPGRYACHPEINLRHLFTLEETVFSDQKLWLWLWLKEEDFWEKDELLWEEEFGLDGADMRRRKQECMRLLNNGEVNSAWEMGKAMARELLHAAGADHEVDDENYWEIDETTGTRKLPAEANIPNMTEKFGSQKRYYTICDYRDRGVPEAEGQTDSLTARGADDEDYDEGEEDEDYDEGEEDEDYDEGEEEEELGTRATVDRTCSTANGSNNLVQQESSRDGSETLSEGETDEDDHAAEELIPQPQTAPDMEHEAPEHVRCTPPRGFFTHTPDMRLKDVTAFLIQFPLPDDFSVPDKSDEPSIPTAKPKSKSRKRKKKGKTTTREEKEESESKEMLNGKIDDSETLNGTSIQPEGEPAATAPKKRKKKPKKKPTPQPPADAITSFTTVTTEPITPSTISPPAYTVTLNNHISTTTSTPAHSAPSSSSSSTHADATEATPVDPRVRNLAAFLTSDSPHKWTSVATLGYGETLNMTLAIRDKYGMETVRRAVVLYATSAGWALV